jgi:hypothetical protein
VTRVRAVLARRRAERALRRAVATAPTVEQAHELTSLAAHG